MHTCTHKFSPARKLASSRQQRLYVVDVISFGAYGTPQDAHDMGLEMEEENLQEATDAAENA
eukprot:2819855-Amphidinium_carterae.1